MRLGVGALEDSDAKYIKDKHHISIATSEQQPPPSLSHWPNRSGENNKTIQTYLKGRDGQRRNQLNVA